MNEQTEIVEFSQTEAALAVLREKYTEIPDFTTKEGYEEGKVGIRELVSLRTGLDKARLALNADDQARIKARNDEAKRITGELAKLEEPMKAAKKAVDDIEEAKKEAARKAEEERIEKIKFRIGEMSTMTAYHAGMSMETLKDGLMACDTLCMNFDFEEFAEAAESERIRVKEHIQKVVLERAKLDKEREELDAEKDRRRAEEEKLAAERKAFEEEQAAARKKQDEERQKIEEERQEAARVMKEAQDRAEAEERRKREEAAAEERRIQAEKDEAERQAREEKLRPEKDKLHDWIAKLRTIDAPAGLVTDDCISLATALMTDLDKLAQDYFERLDTL